MNKTIDYYKKNNVDYINTTKDTDMSNTYKMFEKYLTRGDKILDLGFGSGRDSKYFSTNYDVLSIDPVEEFVKHGQELGLNAKVLSAEDMTYANEFDGIYACASLLHVNEDKLSLCFENCYRALKPGGVMFCSFKYGDFVGYINDRYFVYLTEDSLKNYIGDFKIIEMSLNKDNLANRDIKWLSAILKKEK